jgi:hypothetical protein
MVIVTLPWVSWQGDDDHGLRAKACEVRVDFKGTPLNFTTPHLSSKSCGKQIVANRKVAKALRVLYFSDAQGRKVNVSGNGTRLGGLQNESSSIKQAPLQDAGGYSMWRVVTSASSPSWGRSKAEAKRSGTSNKGHCGSPLGAAEHAALLSLLRRKRGLGAPATDTR